MNVKEVHAEIARRREKIINRYLSRLDSYRDRFLEFVEKNPSIKEELKTPFAEISKARQVAISEKWEAYLGKEKQGISTKFFIEWARLDLSFVAPEIFPLLPFDEGDED